MAKRKRRGAVLDPPPSDPVVKGMLSPRRSVPAHIARPDYALSGWPSERQSRAVRTPDEIERMRIAGRVASEVLIEAASAVAPGVSTDEIDAVAHQASIDRGAYPSPLNYKEFPKSVCTSVNEVICHGIPDSRKLQDGDICNIDVTCFVDGVHGDTNATIAVGQIDDASAELVRTTRRAMHAGIETVRPGSRINDIGRAIETSIKGRNFGIVQEFIGHGIGDQFHTSLQIPHYYSPRANQVLEVGMTFTVEPMITIGPAHLGEIWDDDWTALTLTGQRTAQFEHTLVVTDDGVEILTTPGNSPPAEELFALD